VKTRILRVETPDFVATSTWVKLDGDSTWVCTAASPSIDWIRKAPVHEVKLMIEEKGWKYTWT
jgi:hypothetical protein